MRENKKPSYGIVWAADGEDAWTPSICIPGPFSTPLDAVKDSIHGRKSQLDDLISKTRMTREIIANLENLAKTLNRTEG
jgi:hypothetical protein